MARLDLVRWVVFGSAAIVVYDAVTAVGSRLFGYAYGAWLPGLAGSLAVLAASAFLAARNRGTRTAGAATAAGVALVDVFVGWPVSGAIVPGYFPTGTPTDVLSTLIGVAVGAAALGATLGFVAGSLGVRSDKGVAG